MSKMKQVQIKIFEKILDYVIIKYSVNDIAKKYY